MKKILLALFVLSLGSVFAQKSNKEKTRALILKIAHKDELSSAKTYSSPACLLDSMVGSTYDTLANSWKRVYKEAYAYNSQAYNTSILFYNVTSNNQNSPSLTSSVTMSYNSLGTPTLSMSYFVDQNTNSWVPSGRTTYTYNVSGDKTKQFDEYWDDMNNVWTNGSRTSYSYTSTHSVTIEEGEYWMNNVWTPSYKSTTGYNAANNPTLIVYMTWSQMTNTFDSLQKITFTYNGNVMASAVSYYWNSSINDWENEFAYSYTYSGGNLTFEQEQTWVNGAWSNSGNYTYTYDSQGNLISEVGVVIDPETNEVSDQFRSVYYYKCNLVGIKEYSPKTKFNLYPNPASSFLTVKTETSYDVVRILNISGQLVFESSDSLKSIPVFELNKGIYFIQLLDKNKSILANEKFVKD